MKKNLAWILLSAVLTTTGATPRYEKLWDNDVVPVLDRYCFKCHAGVRQKSGLDLRSLDTILRGGERGPAVIPGNPDGSRLIDFLRADADPHMPPEGKKQLSGAEIAQLRRWISALPETPSANAETNLWVAEYLDQLRSTVTNADVPAADTSPTVAIDTILEKTWREERITPAALCDDRTFVRRLYLDLIGRIPTRSEVESFLASEPQSRREQLITRLLESPEYSRHMAEVFDVVLMGRPKGRNERARRDNGWNAYLENAFRTNQPWNEVVRDIILARGTNAPARGASQFLYEKRNNHQAMAEAIAPIAFGVQIGCAQCHNHPLSWEIEQRHYWGLVAAFNRSKNVDTAQGIGISEVAIGGFVQFTNLKKESQPAELAFLSGHTVAEMRPGPDDKEQDAPELYLVPPGPDAEKAGLPAIPRFSRREALANAATQKNPMLARAFVNRIWQLLLGRGIVHPVDQIDSRHRPSVPALLDWLAADFDRSGRDVKRLIRAITSSRAYQLDSKGAATPPSMFARALDKPLSAEQLTDSLLVVAGRHPPDDRERQELRRTLVRKFPEILPSVYNPSLDQALFLSNSATWNKLLDNSESLSGPPDECIQQATLLAWGRNADPAETEMLKTLFEGTEPEKARRNLLWTLVSSAEFQLNH